MFGVDAIVDEFTLDGEIVADVRCATLCLNSAKALVCATLIEPTLASLGATAAGDAAAITELEVDFGGCTAERVLVVCEFGV